MFSTPPENNRGWKPIWILTGGVFLICSIMLYFVLAFLFGTDGERLPITTNTGAKPSRKATLVYQSNKEVSYVSGLIAQGRRAYVLGEDNSAIFMLDLSQPESPVLTGTYLLPDSYIIDFEAQGHLLYLNTGRLEIIDVADAQHPKKVWEFEPHQQLESILPSRDYLYLIDNEANLYVIDMTSNTSPQYVNVIQNLNNLNYVEYAVVHQDLLFLLDKGLFIFDISNPISPMKIGFYPLPRGIEYFDHAVVSDRYVWVRGKYTDIFGEPAFRVFLLEISNPSQPTEIARYDHYPFASLEDVFCFYHSGTDTESIHLIDFANPTQPVELGYLRGNYSNLGYPRDLTRQGNHFYVYLANYGDGLSIIEYTISPP